MPAEREKRFLRFREVVLYGVFGFLTFLVDSGLFFLLDTLLDAERSFYLLHGCSIFSTLAAIVFAYVTNRKYVFRSKKKGRRAVQREMTEFFLARFSTMLVAECLLELMVSGTDFSASLLKVAVNVGVIILNYLFSKCWIFKDTKEEEA